MDEDAKEDKNTGYTYTKGELFLILLIHFLWLLSILNCLSKYKKFVRSEPSHKMHEKFNIKGVEIIKNVQDAIIYEKRKSLDKLKSRKDPIYLNISTCSNSNKRFSEEFKLKQKSRIKSLSETNLPIPKSMHRNLILKKQNSLSQITNIESGDKEFEIKRISSSEKSSNFAKSHLNKKNCKNRFEKKMRGNSEVSSFLEKSQATPSVIASVEISNQHQVFEKTTSLSPDMIPIHVQRVLLELHARSRTNLSKSETFLNNNIRLRNNPKNNF